MIEYVDAPPRCVTSIVTELQLVNAQVLVQIVSPAESSSAFLICAQPGLKREHEQQGTGEKSRVRFQPTFFVGVDGPNVTFEMFPPDKALSTPIRMAGIGP